MWNCLVDFYKKVIVQCHKKGTVISNIFDPLFFDILEGPSLDWNKIQKLPEDAVMNYADLNSPNKEMVN